MGSPGLLSRQRSLFEPMKEDEERDLAEREGRSWAALIVIVLAIMLWAFWRVVT